MTDDSLPDDFFPTIDELIAAHSKAHNAYVQALAIVPAADIKSRDALTRRAEIDSYAIDALRDRNHIHHDYHIRRAKRIVTEFRDTAAFDPLIILLPKEWCERAVRIDPQMHRMLMTLRSVLHGRKPLPKAPSP